MTETVPLRQGLRKNVAAGFVGWMLPAGVNVLTIPYLLNHLGTVRYGILTLVMISSAYMGFLTGPSTSGAVKFLAGAYSQRDWRLFRSVLLTGILATAGVSLAAAGLMIATSSVMASHLFKIPQELRSLSAEALRYGAVLLFFNGLASAVATIPSAARRVDVSSWLAAALSCGMTLSAVVVVAMRGSITAILIGQICVAAGFIVAGLFTWMVVLPREALLPLPRLSLTNFSSYFLFSGQLSIGAFLSTVLLQLDRVIVGSQLGPAAVTAYAVPARIAEQTAGLLARLTAPLYPLAAEAQATNSVAEYYLLHKKAVSTLLWLAGLIAAVLTTSGGSMLAVWIGHTLPAQSSVILAVLALANVARVPSTVAYQSGNGFGRGGIYVAASGGGVVVVGTLAVLLTHLWGLVGTSLGFLFGMIVLSLSYDIYVRRHVMHCKCSAIGILVEYVPTMVLVGVCNLVVQPLLSGHVQSLLLVVASVVVTVVVYVVATLLCEWVWPGSVPVDSARASLRARFSSRSPVPSIEPQRI